MSSWELRFLCASLFIKMVQILGDCLGRPLFTFLDRPGHKHPGQRYTTEDLYVSLLQLQICWPQALHAERQHEIASKTPQFEMPSKSMRNRSTCLVSRQYAGPKSSRQTKPFSITKFMMINIAFYDFKKSEELLNLSMNERITYSGQHVDCDQNI